MRRIDEIPQPEPARACHSQPHTCREVRRNARTLSVRFEVVSELRETARPGRDKLYGTAISDVACIILEPPSPFRVQESPETPVRASEAITRLLQESPTRHLCNHNHPNTSVSQYAGLPNPLGEGICCPPNHPDTSVRQYAGLPNPLGEGITHETTRTELGVYGVWVLVLTSCLA